MSFIKFNNNKFNYGFLQKFHIYYIMWIIIFRMNDSLIYDFCGVDNSSKGVFPYEAVNSTNFNEYFLKIIVTNYY